MVEDESDPTPEELREAEALARALERQASAGDAPRDALETAALLRYARDGGALPPERERALADRLRARPAAPSRRTRILVSALAGTLAAAASVLLALRANAPRVEAPVPPLELLTAQARAAAREPGALAALDLEMQRHRRALHASLGLGSGESR
jgi:hypothetical protein